MDKPLLEAALAGLQHQLAGITAAMDAVRKRLAAGPRPRTEIVEAPKLKRKLTAASRKRIAAAQKKRWAEYRAQKKK